VAYRRPYNGTSLLSGLSNNRNIFTNDSLSFIHKGGWRLEDCGFYNTVSEVEGISEVEATYPSPVLSTGLFWIDSI